MSTGISPGSLPPAIQEAVQSLTTTGWHLRGEDSIALASFTILLFDHLLTFEDEIEFIWSKKISPVSLLFLLNRYFSPPAFAIALVAVFSPACCHNFAKFEGVVTVVTVLTAELMLLLRVYAVYERNRAILGILGFIWIAQLCCMSFTLAHSGPVVIPRTSVTYGCVLVADPKIGNLDIMFTVPTVVFDTTTFILLSAGLLHKARTSRTASRLGNLMFQDGLMYFLIVVIMNTGWTVTGLTLSSDLKNILSFPSTAATVILIGRLTLNLKRYGAEPVKTDAEGKRLSASNSWLRRRMAFIIGQSSMQLPHSPHSQSTASMSIPETMPRTPSSSMFESRDIERGLELAERDSNARKAEEDTFYTKTGPKLFSPE